MTVSHNLNIQKINLDTIGAIFEFRILRESQKKRQKIEISFTRKKGNPKNTCLNGL